MKKVLIIEDEQNIAQLEQDYLEVHGIESDIASTGEEGLNLATTNSYNLIILDLMLPGIDGFALCEKLRKNLDIPILMVTARKEDIDKIKGFDRGADDYIVKPFNPNELVARVKAHLSRYDRLTNRNNASTDIQINNLLIQPDARRIFVNGEEIIFTAKEFDLLYFLAAKFYTAIFPESQIHGAIDDTSGNIISFDICGHRFIAFNGRRNFTFNPAISFFIHFNLSKDENIRKKIEEVWEKLSDDGKVLMPFDQYPFSEKYGWIQDKYGLSWQLMLSNLDEDKLIKVVPSFMFTNEIYGKAEEAIHFYLSVSNIQISETLLVIRMEWNLMKKEK